MQPQYTPTRKPRKPRKDLTGQRFGRLVVLGVDLQRSGRGNTYWHCQCDCGGAASVTATGLHAGTQSCGCLRREFVASKKTHGKTGTSMHNRWVCMRQRCKNPNHPAYANYGGRGITVCDRWDQSFEAFLVDMGEPPTPDHTIDRIDNDGPYSPENCRWITATEQNRNQRRSTRITVDGITRTVVGWAEVMGISQETIRQRIRRGMSPEEAVTLPVGYNAQSHSHSCNSDTRP